MSFRKIFNTGEYVRPRANQYIGPLGHTFTRENTYEVAGFSWSIGQQNIHIRADSFGTDLSRIASVDATAFELACEPAPAPAPAPGVGLPVDSAERKRTPMCTGLLDYFTAALAEVAKVSFAGNEKHNPGQPLHHARGKSTDHPDCIVRHLTERGGRDENGMRHTAALAWRALALLQEELEAEGAPKARGAK